MSSDAVLKGIMSAQRNDEYMRIISLQATLFMNISTFASTSDLQSGTALFGIYLRIVES